MEITEEQFEEKFKNLPERFREMVFSADVDDTVGELSRLYGLLGEEKREALKGGVVLLLVGLSTGEDFIRDAKEKLAISQETAGKIFLDVTDLILNPIMNRFYWRGETEEKERAELTPEEEKEIEKSIEADKLIDKTYASMEPTPGVATSSDELKEAIDHLDFGTIIPTLGEKYGLTIIKQGLLERKIKLLITGNLSASDFERQMQSELGLNPEQAKNIINDINQFVLTPVRMAYLGMEEEAPSPSQERAGVRLEQTSFAPTGVVGAPSPEEKNVGDEIRVEAERKKILEGIESPTKISGVKTVADILKEEKTKNLVEQKMAGAFSLPKEETDYSMRKIDPYREQPDK